MKYDFDKVIDRSGTAAEKLEGLNQIWGRTDLIPLWVADMDFATAPFVMEAIRKRCENEVLGYTGKPDSYYAAIVDWVGKRYDMTVAKEMIHFVPGIVPGIGMAMNCFTRKGDKVMIQPPVYHPFSWLTTRNERVLVANPLKWENGMYRMDKEAFRRQIKGCKLFILCNPHNPGGVVWTEEELRMVADVCYDEKVLVFSDEIHADLTLPPRKHRPFAAISEKARMNSVTFMSPSKAFNMPGLSASHAIIFNEELRNRFRAYIDAGELDMGHVFAFLSVEAAYSHGTEWLDQCLAYIQGNIDFVDEFLKRHAPKIKVVRPEASYLVWLDCRELGMSQEALNDFFVDKARLALNDGAMFGKEGTGFMRLNVASPRCVIEKAMGQLAEAYRIMEG
ncbi:MalY/PatB family protein [Phocaeicola sp.]|uniref:MalY/PatB family protein n=1 Tax=Phocaeicola sp. TaxID=2773926 RepID=UPI0023BE6B8C|nr:PatB family C-S lyase [Phocaeicola sp.]MDE5677328.1 PatB family C-S lyase [Phocaeicola sp.]